jgi:hypothetical protein
MFSKLSWYWKIEEDYPPIPSFEKISKHFHLDYIGPLHPKIQFKVAKNLKCLNSAVLINQWFYGDWYFLITD